MRHVTLARSRARALLVPELAVGESFTKLRYDKRVSPRRDAGLALSVFDLVDRNPDVFRVVPVPPKAYESARDLLSKYRDQNFSFVDAVTFITADRHVAVDTVLTVDDRDFRAYRFARNVTVVTPQSADPGEVGPS